MSPSLFPTLAGLFIMLFAAVSVAFTDTSKQKTALLGYVDMFSKGILLAISLYLSLIAVSAAGWVPGMIAVIIGALIFEIIRYAMPAHTEPTRNKVRAALSADALSNASHGLFIAGAFAVNIFIGIGASFGILFHSISREIEQHRLLREIGHEKTPALVRNILISATILIGLFTALGLVSFPYASSLLSGLAAGGILSVVLHDLIPQVIASGTSSGSSLLSGFFALMGTGAVYASFLLSGTAPVPAPIPPTIPTANTPAAVAPLVPAQTHTSQPPVTHPTSPPNSPAQNNLPTQAPTTQGTPSGSETTEPAPEEIIPGAAGTKPEQPVEEPAEESSGQSDEEVFPQ